MSLLWGVAYNQTHTKTRLLVFFVRDRHRAMTMMSGRVCAHRIRVRLEKEQYRIMSDKNDNRFGPPKKPGGWSSKGGGQLLIIAVVLVIALWVAIGFENMKSTRATVEYTYSQFIHEATNGRITNVIIRQNNVTGQGYTNGINNGETVRVPIDFETYIPYPDSELVSLLIAHDIRFKGEPKKENFFPLLLMNILPVLLLIGVIWFFMFRQVQGANNRAMSFGKSKARQMRKEDVEITFKDVEGCEEAKQELVEVIEFLKDPARFTRIGAKIPKGVILVGPPGTGKTLLAKAVAGEANVPFFNMSGSEFVEMFVGVGASRVRDLFEQGKKSSPCIIFIDELDAVGRTRGAGYGGGHDEREQTLNQMLVEMDGFDTNTSVIVMAATNRPDVLDPALLRPGRFDRQVIVDKPDIKGREGILRIHSTKVKLEDDVNLMDIARGTPGFSGADLANLINEGALLAARRGKETISMKELEEAKDKVLMGPERRSMLISEKEKKNTAYHESGHALIAALLKEGDKLHKVTIIPRGRSLGSTWRLPLDGRYSYTRTRILEEITVLLGGRIAEEVKFGEGNFTNGSAQDIEHATALARRMVCEWGMSKLGAMTFGQKEQPIFLGKEISRHQDYSEETARKIDAEIESIISEQYRRAQRLIKDNKRKLENLAEALLEREALNMQELEEVLGIPLEREEEKLMPAGRKYEEVQAEQQSAANKKDEESSEPEQTTETASDDDANETEAEEKPKRKPRRTSKKRTTKKTDTDAEDKE